MTYAVYKRSKSESSVTFAQITLYEQYFMMKVLVLAAVAIAIFAHGKPVIAEKLISTINEEGEYIVEDVDKPVAATYAVDINKLRFMLYTQNNKDTPYQLKNGDVNNFKSSPFNPNVPTKFIVHGWESSYEADPPQGLKKNFLDALNVNVIMLDWKEYNSPYLSAFGSAKNIGKNFATFIQFLISNGLKNANIQIIGHSLGAHIAGFIGKNMSSKIPRITGLDPAGPLFEDAKADGRLDGGDAAFVDAIHSSTMAGISKQITQADFFPNGGSNQPTCLTAPIVGGCDHTAGYIYYGVSITQRSKYPARKCSSESDAKVADSKSNNCVSSNVVMGDDAINRSASGIYYVDMSV